MANDRHGREIAGTGPADAEARAYLRTIVIIAAVVLVLGLSEAAYGLSLESGWLVKDGLEWGYDVVIYGLAAVSFGRGGRIETMAAVALAAVLAIAGLQTGYEVWRAGTDPRPVEPFSIELSAVLIIVEGVAVAVALWRFRRATNPVIEATWLSARNDALIGTLYTLVTMAARLLPMRWPQMGVDALSALLSLQAAWVVACDVLRARRLRH